MKRLVLGFVVTLFSISIIGCDSGGETPTTPAPGAGAPAKAAGGPPKAAANPNGPKNDH
jgi:hypothetical protein